MGKNKRVQHKKVTVTVGIPAYNEEANIKYLLSEILSQKLNKVVLKKIIIASDGSDDKTVELAMSISDKRISIFNNKERKGATAMQDQIFAKATSDIVVLLDADISLKGITFLEQICKPIVEGNVDLVSAKVMPLIPRSFIEKVLSISHRFKEEIAGLVNNGNNVLTCHGTARAFSKNLYKKIRFNKTAGEDAYSYFYTITNGYKYKYTKKCHLLY